MKLLIVEDQKSLSDSIVSYLKIEGNLCETAFNFESAVEKISLYKYDCILVDINLPDGNGFEIIRKIKLEKILCGIIIISARDTVDDRIKGLETGADDYIVKPFDMAELNARIKSLIRRINFSGENIIQIGKITIFPEQFQVKVNNDFIDLTKKEYDLLMFLVSNINRVVTKETIAEHLWGDYVDMSDSFDFVYSHMKNLRKKLQEKGLIDYIKTIYGLGYKFNIID
ncbi:MAG: response regulator transcription factor [Bacteroidales bacterium]|nr:response regulator transcription factor [Bacteroidales bacterium]MBN2756196.1 response regulator transcription factor [Bacteroidales bacterium]